MELWLSLTLYFIRRLLTNRCKAEFKALSFKIHETELGHIRQLEFPVFSTVTKSCSEFSREDAYSMAGGETDFSHSSLLILRGQGGTRRGRTVSGRGRVKGGSRHCVTVLSSSIGADRLRPYRGFSFLFVSMEAVCVFVWFCVCLHAIGQMYL